MKIFRTVILLFLFLSAYFCQSQNKKTAIPDSITTKLSKVKTVTGKIQILYDHANAIWYTDFDLTELLLNKAEALAFKAKDHKWVVQINAYLAYLYCDYGEHEKSAGKIAKGKKYVDKVDDKTRLTLYMSESSYYDAIKQFDKCIELREKEIELARASKDSVSLAASLHNIGISYFKKGNPILADSFIRAAYFINKLRNQENYILSNITMLANVQGKLGNPQKAIEYNNEALAMAVKRNDLNSICLTNINIAADYMLLKDYATAMQKLDLGYDLSLKYGFKEWRSVALAHYAQLFELKNDFKTANRYFKMEKALKDSMLNEKSVSALADLEKELSLKKVELLEQEKEKNEAKIHEQKILAEKRTIQFYSMLGGIALLIIGLVIVLRSFIIKKRANTKILEQKKLLEEQNTEIAFQKITVEIKNKEIVDSITYAKRLQNAIFPPTELIKKHFPESFILYKPKDIVAGDFYWMESFAEATDSKGNKQNKILFAVADCTGHGVPGAMVSVVCSNALNRAVKEFKLTDPGKILDKAREIVTETFENSESDVKDGMDISLCCIELNSNRAAVGSGGSGNISDGSTTNYKPETIKLTWAGANNPLFIVRKNHDRVNEATHSFEEEHSFSDEERSKETISTKYIKKQNIEIIEIKPNKQTVGKSDGIKPFTTQSIDLRKEDVLYLFSDGFGDQFGGPKGKKLKSANFQKLLIEFSGKVMDQQFGSLSSEFDKWKDSYEQTDDICVIGLRI